MSVVEDAPEKTCDTCRVEPAVSTIVLGGTPRAACEECGEHLLSEADATEYPLDMFDKEDEQLDLAVTRNFILLEREGQNTEPVVTFCPPPHEEATPAEMGEREE